MNPTDGRSIDAATFESLYETVSSGTLTVPLVHQLSFSATLETLRAMKRAVIAGPATSLTIDALYRVFRGDISAARRNFALALRSCAPDERAYVVDLAVPYLMTACSFAEMNAHLDSVDLVPSGLQGPLTACRAIVRAAQGEFTKSRQLCDVAIGYVAEESPPLYALTLARTALAAYYRREYDIALERSLQAAQLFEAQHFRWPAACTYATAATISLDWARDAERTQLYAARMMRLSDSIGNRGIARWAVVELFVLAGQVHDERRHARYRRRLLRHPSAQGFAENAAIALSDAQAFCWKGDFEAAFGTLQLLDRSGIRDESEEALLDAFLAVIAVARNDHEAAARLSRDAIRRSARGEKAEQLCDIRNRERARVLAAATCFVIGEAATGRRALSAEFDPTGLFLSSLHEGGIDEGRVPPLFRGDAAAINSAVAAYRRIRPRTVLSRAELDVLRHLRDGGTLAAIATEMGKSTKTVQRQVESIYSKLQVNTRAKALEAGRALQLLP